MNGGGMRPAQDFSGLDERKFNLAYAAFKGKIHTFSRNAKRSLPSMDIEDIEQELCYTLMRCVRDYDPNKGASFNTLAQGSFQRKIMDLIRFANTKSRKAEIVYLEAEEVRIAVDRLLAQESAEETALLSISVTQSRVLRLVSKALNTTDDKRRARLVAKLQAMDPDEVRDALTHVA